jgi:Ca2+-binding RTX toxin-like protein
MADYSDSPVSVLVSLATGRGFNGTAEGDTLVNIENLFGSSHSDILTGNDQRNIIFGSTGDDYIDGGAGNDHLVGGIQDDTADGGNDTLRGGGDTDFLYGGNGNDDLDGGTERDLLFGEAGNDTLKGGDGSDDLNGGANVDQLTGGLGNDHFIWTAISETGVTPDTWDTITDFNRGQGDLIDLTAIDADETTPGHQDFTAASFVGDASGGFTAPGQIGFIHSGGDTFIVINTNADANGDAVIHLMGMYTPDWSWFVHA